MKSNQKKRMGLILVAAIFAALTLSACSTTPAPMESRKPTLGRDKVVIKDGVVSRRGGQDNRAAQVNKTPETSHRVAVGETLYSIATSNGLLPQEVADWNGLSDPTKISVGQVLRLTPPEGYSPAQTAPLQTVAPVESRTINMGGVGNAPTEIPTLGAPPARVKTSPKVTKEPYSKERLAALSAANTVTPPPVETTAPQVATPPTQTATATTPPSQTKPAEPQVAASNKLTWIWPTQGKLVTRFSESASLKGIDIVGAIGQPIVASAAGRVVYVGSGLRGYGKLVIVKHNDAFLTVYAHNRELYVSQGDAVKQGQKIAEMGNTDADQVKLHFEVRQDGKPVDPLKFLPTGSAKK